VMGNVVKGLKIAKIPLFLKKGPFFKKNQKCKNRAEITPLKVHKCPIFNLIQ